MSRREEEFKHRTSIFEGAYRAWSHLGGLEPDELEQKSAKDLDPVTYVLSNDSRPGANKKTKNVNDDGSARLDCPYEPLPRSGLSHPFVQAILAPWLGPNADNEAVELGLATLRTWWQHRRKGENKSSVKTLGTAKMRVVVDKYARHFFDLAHCLVVSDDAQPPRTLHIKLKQMSKERRESQGLSMMDDDDDISASVLLKSGGNTHPAATLSGVNENAPGGPLEQLHAAQNLQHFQGLSLSGNSGPDLNTGPLVNVKGKCIPGKIDLPGMVEAVSRHSNQLAHRGGLLSVLQSSKAGDGSSTSLNASNTNDPSMYGDPTTTPVVFQSRQGQHFFIVMNVNGITCAHCVKIVETVLKGCNGGKSPIVGLLDAAADRGLSCVVIQIDSPKNAKRIAFESARNLALVGYTALSKEISTNMVTSSSSSSPDQSAMSNATKLESIQKAMMKLNQAYPFELFEFPPLCSCPDSGVFRENCPRHAQMNDRMFKALANHERHLAEYVQSRNRSSGNGSSGGGASSQPPQQGQMYQGIMPHGMNGGVAVADVDDYAKPLVIDQPMQFPALDAPLDLIEKASDVEPIPFEELHLSASSSSSAMYQQQQQQGSVVANALLNEAMNQHNGNVNLGNSCGSDYCHPTYGAASNGAAPRYTYGNSVSNNNGSGSGNNHGGQSNNGNTMDPRNSVSALSIDWETFEMLEQTVDSMDHAAAAAAAAQQQLQYHSQNSQQLLQPHHDALQGGFHPISQTANGGTVQLQGGLAYQV